VKQTLEGLHTVLDQAAALGQEMPMLRLHCDVLEACVRAAEAEWDNSSASLRTFALRAAMPGTRGA
jgi:hypothetical protein